MYKLLVHKACIHRTKCRRTNCRDKVSPYEVSRTKFPPDEVSPYEVSPDEVSPYEVSPYEVSSYEMSPDEVSRAKCQITREASNKQSMIGRLLTGISLTPTRGEGGVTTAVSDISLVLNELEEASSPSPFCWRACSKIHIGNKLNFFD